MEENLYSPPEANVDNKETDNSELASRWSRIGASILDMLTILPFTIPLMYLTGGFEILANEGQLQLFYGFLMGMAGIVIFAAIHGKIMLRDGQTWGKKALDIKIVKIDDKPVDFNCLAKRYGFYWLVPQIPFVGQFLNFINVMFAFGKARRCIHDYLGGTKVVKVNN